MHAHFIRAALNTTLFSTRKDSVSRYPARGAMRNHLPLPVLLNHVSSPCEIDPYCYACNQSFRQASVCCIQTDILAASYAQRQCFKTIIIIYIIKLILMLEATYVLLDVVLSIKY